MAETKIVASRISQTVEFSFSELSLGNGTVSLPALAWASDQDTGIYRGGANFLSVSCGGSDMASFAGIGAGAALLPGIDNTYELGSEALGWKRLFMLDGTSALPAFSFRNDANTGLYRPSADTIGIALGGTARHIFDSSSLTIINDASELRLQRSSNGRTPIIAIYDAFGGLRLHTPNSNAESTTVAYQLECDNPSTNSILGKVIANGQWQFQDGTAAIPSISFLNDTNLGLYRIGTDEMGVAAAGGNLLFRFGFAGGLQTLFRGGTSAGLPGLALGEASGVGFYRISGLDQLGISAPVNIVDGSASIPAYSFASDLNTGIYWRSADAFGFSAAGGLVATLNTTGFSIDAGTLQVLNGSAASPVVQFGTDPDTGIYRGGTNIVGISSGGVQAALFNTTAGANLLTLNLNVGDQPVHAISMNNTFSGTSADVRMNLGVNDGSAGDPYILFAIGGPTTYWSIGVDNSNSDVMAFSRTAGGTAKPGTGDIVLMTNNNIQLIDGTATDPAYTFINDSNTGIFRGGTDVVAVSVGGTRIADFNTTVNRTMVTFQPATDNAFTLGGASSRWTTVYATNGTINTSHSSTKSNIVEIDPTQVALPEGVFYDRDGRRYVGYINDSLPIEARPIENGKIEETMNYEHSVIGVLCAHVKKLTEEVAALKAKLGE